MAALKASLGDDADTAPKKTGRAAPRESANEEGHVGKGLIGDDLQAQARKEGFIGDTGEEAHSCQEMSTDDERCG